MKRRDRYHLIARGAFGDLYLFGEQTGFSEKIFTHISRYRGSEYELTAVDMDRQAQDFFLGKEKASVDFDSMFEPAKKKLGMLNMMKCMASFQPWRSAGKRPYQPREG